MCLSFFLEKGAVLKQGGGRGKTRDSREDRGGRLVLGNASVDQLNRKHLCSLILLGGGQAGVFSGGNAASSHGEERCPRPGRQPGRATLFCIRLGGQI